MCICPCVMIPELPENNGKRKERRDIEQKNISEYIFIILYFDLKIREKTSNPTQ